MYYPTSFFIDKSGYNEYIRSHAPKQLNKVIDELDEEDVIDGCRIGLPNNCAWRYDCLWLIDAGKEFIPVLIQNINTSSEMALWSCGISPEEDDEIEWSFDELINYVGESWQISLKKIIQEKYCDKPIEK